MAARGCPAASSRTTCFFEQPLATKPTATTATRTTGQINDFFNIYKSPFSPDTFNFKLYHLSPALRKAAISLSVKSG
jgi:hypothetical protein